MPERQTGLVRYEQQRQQMMMLPQMPQVHIPPPAPADESPAEIGLLKMLWRQKWIVLSVLAISAAAALIYIKEAQRLYTSTARIYVQQMTGGTVASGSALSVRPDSYLYTQCEMIMSTPLLEQVLDQDNLKELKTFSNSSMPLQVMRYNLATEVGRKTDDIAVSYTSPYPEESAQIVSALVNHYIESQTAERQNIAGTALNLLEEAQAKDEKALDDVQGRIAEFKKKNMTLTFQNDKGTSIINSDLAKNSDLLHAAEIKTVESKLEYDTAQKLAADPAAMSRFLSVGGGATNAIAPDADVDRLRTQLSDWQLRLAAVQTQYGPSHPEVQRDKGYIDVLQKQIADKEKESATRYLSRCQAVYETAKLGEETYRKMFEDQQKRALDLTSAEQEYSKLDNEQKRTERELDFLAERIKTLTITKDAQSITDVHVVEPARAEFTPSWPLKSRVLGIALGAGLLLGTGLGLLRDWMDQRIHSAEEVTALLGLPVLGVVPSMAKGSSQASRGQQTHLEIMSDVAEAYRTIRTAIYFGVPADHSKTILVTSPLPGEGKSTSASNLAIAMAQAGRRVLLIDADFRKPSQQKIWEVNDAVGLSTALAGRETLDRVIQRTAVEGLDILPCGPVPLNPAEILNSEAFGELLEKLGARYDHIVLDSPPVLPVTDARILGALADVTLLVIRAEKSTRSACEHAHAGLQSVGSRILGVIVNDAPRGRAGQSYYGGYGYYGPQYGYGVRAGERGNGNGHTLPRHLTHMPMPPSDVVEQS